eukprot:523450-Rhodomonas_salina.1
MLISPALVVGRLGTRCQTEHASKRGVCHAVWYSSGQCWASRRGVGFLWTEPLIFSPHSTLVQIRLALSLHEADLRRAFAAGIHGAGRFSSSSPGSRTTSTSTCRGQRKSEELRTSTIGRQSIQHGPRFESSSTSRDQKPSMLSAVAETGAVASIFPLRRH